LESPEAYQIGLVFDPGKEERGKFVLEVLFEIAAAEYEFYAFVLL
jgi:hypothetical protein